MEDLELKIYWLIQFMWNSRNGKLIYSDRKQIRDCLRPGVQERGTIIGKEQGSFGGVGNVLHLHRS